MVLIARVNAQATFSIKSGVNFASIIGEDVDFIKGRTSWNIGAVAEMEISSASAVQLELLYSGQGFTLEDGNIDEMSIEAGTVKMNYLYLPVLYKYLYIRRFFFRSWTTIRFFISIKS